MNSQTWWYLARAGGIVAWAILTLSVLLGVTLAIRPPGRRIRRPWVLDLHRWLGGLAVSFTGVHVASLVADSYVHFGLSEVLVPFSSEWKPGAVTWGVISLWVLAAVEVTSLLRRRLPRRAWWSVHLTSYVLFWTATIHGVTSGSDAMNPFYVGAAVVAIWGTTSAAIVRIAGRGEPTRASRADPTTRARVQDRRKDTAPI